jgi:hypothetical protein
VVMMVVSDIAISKNISASLWRQGSLPLLLFLARIRQFRIPLFCFLLLKVGSTAGSVLSPLLQHFYAF